MAKIGILVTTSKIKERQVSKKASYDNMKHFGFRKIIDELDRSHKISYISEKGINDVDYVLTSIVSYYDAYNFIHNFYGKEIKSKIIVGGAGMSNPIPFRNQIYAACWGRGEGLINSIIGGEDLENVWYPKKDWDLSGKYKIGQLKEFIAIDQTDQNEETPTHMKGFKEVHIGCRKKCYFCQYTWKNELKTDEKQIGYKSGLNDCENTIAETDWSLNNPYFITAIDGATEKARRTVNRANITDNAIRNTIHKYFQTSTQKRTVLKLYCVVGYPFESINDVDFSDLYSIIEQCDNEVINTEGRYLQIFVQCTHFVPMPFTPMEGEPCNPLDIRGYHRKEKLDYKGKNIRLWILPYMTSNASAFEQAILNRMKFDDDKVTRAMVHPAYQKMSTSQRLDFIHKNIPERMYGRVFGKIHEFVDSPFEIEKAKKAYYGKVAMYYGQSIMP